MYPHRIRLRGPWRVEPIRRFAGAGDLPSAQTCQFPCRWADIGLAGFRGTVRHRRSFGLPRRLDEWERVWLVIEEFSDDAAVILNGQQIAHMDHGKNNIAVEITTQLNERNELCIDVSADRDAGLSGGIGLEIRATAWLEDVQGELIDEGRLRVRGRICGASDRPLDAYVIAGRRIVFQTTVHPQDACSSFEWSAELTHEQDREPIVVELVHGSAIWYRKECPLQKSARPSQVS